MGKVGESTALISWHKGFRVHPIDDPRYARENLVSLAETMVMLYFYYVILILVLHFLAISGVIEAETLPWLIIETNAANILSHIPREMSEDRLNILVAILTTIVAARSVRYSFDILKADMHPGKRKKKHV